MQTITTTTAGTSRSASLFGDGPRVVERTRGSAHPTVPTTRPAGAGGPHRILSGRR
jgi:hypothetical protein